MARHTKRKSLGILDSNVHRENLIQLQLSSEKKSMPPRTLFQVGPDLAIEATGKERQMGGEKILAIDNDPLVLQTLTNEFERQGLGVVAVDDPIVGIRAIEADPSAFACVLTDYEMPKLNGNELCSRVKATAPKVPVFVITGYDSLDSVDNVDVETLCLEAGADGFFKKSEIDDWLEACRIVVEQRKNRKKKVDGIYGVRERAEKINTILGLQGSSKALAKVADKVKTFAESNETVLILGESGVGKEEIAKAIHLNSNRSTGPFIAVNCGAIPNELLESILFGHEKGSFTGAISKQLGKFKEAHSGTLFLDEIGDMEPLLKIKILRALQDKKITPIGGKEEKVNCRIVAATNKNLEDLVKGGTFRDDLYFRLKILSLTVPPLRERPEDIEPIVRKLVEDKNKHYGAKKQLSNNFIKKLRSKEWRGNVRELMGFVTTCYTMSETVVVVGDNETSSLGTFNVKGTYDTFIESIRKAKRELFEEQIRASENKKEAARRLGINYKLFLYHVSEINREAKEGELKI